MCQVGHKTLLAQLIRRVEYAQSFHRSCCCHNCYYSHCILCEEYSSWAGSTLAKSIPWYTCWRVLV